MKKLEWTNYEELLGYSEADSDGLPTMEDLFNVKILKTNFPIYENMAMTVCEIPGVEMFSYISKYKAFTSICELFDEDKVKKDVEFALFYPESFSNIQMIKCEKTKKLILERRDELSFFDHWAILMAPNGEIKSVFSDKKDEFNEKRNELEDYNNIYRGIIVSSER